MLSAQAAAPQRARAASAPTQTFQPPQTFQKYCFECHGGTKRKGGVSIERLIRQSAQSSVGALLGRLGQDRRDAGDRPDAAAETRRSSSRRMTNARRRRRGSGRR